MPEAELAAWRAARLDAGTPLPDPEDGDGFEAVSVFLDEIAVGGGVLTYGEQGGRSRAALRQLQTTLPHDAAVQWAAVLGALEAHVRAQGVQTWVTGVPPALAGVYRAAGFRATMTGVSKRLDPSSAPELQEDRRVAVRPMELDERRRFASEVTAFLRSGMERSGVLAGSDASLGPLDDRIAHLADDVPPENELLMTGLVDGVPVGRAWATLATDDDGNLDFIGNTIDLFPEFRGQRLTRSFLGALRRHVQTIGVREVHLRVYAHDTGARRTFLDEGAGVDTVHLRKDLA